MTRRYVVIGGGAVGGALTAQLVPSGHDVVLVARGAHGESIAEHGLVVRRPDRVDVVGVPVVERPEGVDLRPDDVLLLTVKTQDAEAALAAWAWRPVEGGGLAADLPLVTFQNGLLTEDLALRRFNRVYGATIGIAASHLTPGEIVSPSLPPAVGLVWLGRYLAAPDTLQDELVADLVGAGFAAWSVPDVRAEKAAKLLGNVGNGLDLFTGDDDDRDRVRTLLRDEALAVLAAAGLPLPPGGELDRGAVDFRVLPVEGHVGGRLSTWQSFARGASSEVDYLNGEVVLLARRHGVPAPVNEALQRLLGPAGADRSGGELPSPSYDELLAADRVLV
ncbi:2-dehydropantoate 2-reductase N-terminal domain-containing protein [Nocardioides sp. 1609]|uniref:ketopantoate reductase family protein n=1 Tax=Nocardioides sp. 1609 TaxID=2508327 RepID=UPI00142FBB93|nr:2-dehydropantoate 2-reductase N-terminal domain-containing protein [Nocardioides sp. 1609]